MSKLLEVCVDSLDSAITAVKGGANRLELCSSLIDGGLTPTPGLLIQILNNSCISNAKIPIYCMIRCRPGNFIYTSEEIEIMKEDAKILKKYGANGFVFGALLENGDVDMKKCREVIKVAYPLPVTFHRAFDFCRRPTIEIEVIIDLGFKRILTSGKQPTAQLGVKLIKKLMEQVGDRIIIMPGGGINKDNLSFIIENTEAKEYHGSFKKLKETDKKSEDGDNQESGEKSDEKREEEIIIGDDSNRPLYIADKDCIAEIVHILRNI